MSSIRVDLGGGAHPLDGHINVDAFTDCDVKLDLNKVGRGESKLPWSDRTVDSVYSSHCFEHLTDIHKLWWEIARILKPGHGAEIRVPHWANSQANMMGHVRTLSEHDIIQMYEFPETHWSHGEPWLRLHRIQYVPGRNFKEVKAINRRYSDLQVCRFIQDTCHELRFHFVSEIADFSQARTIADDVFYEVI